jgi:hypothetical protein
MMQEVNRAKFPLGQVVATPGAMEALREANTDAVDFLRRHIRGDWGEVDDYDQQQNELSLREGYRILSAYTLVTGVKLWVITEADRSATTILLPSEY